MSRRPGRSPAGGRERPAAPGGPLEAGVVLAVEQLRRRVPGGVGTYARGLLVGLSQLGQGAPPLELFASRGRRPDPLAGLGLPLRRSPLPSAALVGAWSLGLAGVGAGPALTHAVSLAAPPSAPRLVVTVHDLTWRALPSAFPARGRRWHEAALGRALRRATAFVVPSEPVAAALVEAGATPSAVRVIAEGSDHLPPADVEGARRHLAAAGVAGPFLLGVGTIEPRKNLRRLVAAYGLARPRLPEPWPLVLLGPEGWGGHLGTAGALPPGVVLGGHPDDAVLAGCYALARCLAYVPLLEGFGLPVVEAMAAGLPVVSSAVPSAAGASLLIDPANETSIADGILSASTDETVRQRLAAAGRERTGALTWLATAAAHVALWEEVAREGPHRERRRPTGR